VGGYQTTDTIVAPATALATSALGMVRLSGANAWQIACDVLDSPPAKIQPQRAYLAKLTLPGIGEAEDAGHSTGAVLVFWQAPNSYTGEDLVELTVHGNPLLVRQLCDACTEAGARPAEAGEFTYRAMLNGKLDLVQAEAVQELITAGSARAMLLAEASLAGTPSRLVEGWAAQLTSMLANIEVIHDYAADDLDASLNPADLLTPERLHGGLGELAAQLEQALEDSRRTAPLRAGITVAITGPPNVGKSTLFNALLGHERAITDCAPGTPHLGGHRGLPRRRQRGGSRRGAPHRGLGPCRRPRALGKCSGPAASVHPARTGRHRAADGRHTLRPAAGLA